MTNVKLFSIFILFLSFGSGFAGLTYELVWVKELSLLFGQTTLAVTLVVAVYMGGLGLGSIYWGKKVDSSKHPIKLFSLLELGTALSALVIVLIFPIVPDLYKFFFNTMGLSYSFSLFPISLITVVLLFIPTFMMGGVFPVLSRLFYLLTQKENVGSIYGVNTLGAIIGGTLTGFYLIGYFGKLETQYLAIGINFTLALTAFLFKHKFTNTHTAKSPVEESTTLPNTSKKYLYLTAIIGFSGIAFQIVTTRALNIVLANSVYVFTSILIIYLLGISLGSLLYSNYLKKRYSKESQLYYLLMSSGLYMGITVLFLNELPDIMYPIRLSIHHIPVLNILFPGLFSSLLLLFIPALLSGVTFPLCYNLFTTQLNSIGKESSLLYGWNTVGSILGSLLGGLVLIPLLGVTKSIIFIGFSLMVYTAYTFRKTQNISKFSMIILGLSTIPLYFSIQSPVIHPPTIYRSDNVTDTIPYYKETISGTVLVRKDLRTGIKSLYVNNAEVCGSTYDALKVVKALGHVPFFINPEIKDVLIIGFGLGVTASEIARHPVNPIECVELCPGVKEASSTYFSDLNNNIVDSDKINFYSGDGRNYLFLSQKKYDLISCDPTHPTVGSGNLYTKEYFELCKKHLTPKGVVCQYLPLHRLSPDEFKSSIKTFSSVFPHSTVWLAHTHGILMGSPSPIRINFNHISNTLNKLNDTLLTDPYHTATSLMLDHNAIKTISQNMAIHSDNRPFIEYFTSESIKPENWHLNLTELLKVRSNPAIVIKNISLQNKMNRYLIGQTYFLNGLIYKNKGRLNEVVKFYEKAMEINPENEEIKTFFNYEQWRQKNAHSKTP